MYERVYRIMQIVGVVGILQLRAKQEEIALLTGVEGNGSIYMMRMVPLIRHGLTMDIAKGLSIRESVHIMLVLPP